MCNLRVPLYQYFCRLYHFLYLCLSVGDRFYHHLRGQFYSILNSLFEIETYLYTTKSPTKLYIYIIIYRISYEHEYHFGFNECPRVRCQKKISSFYLIDILIQLIGFEHNLNINKIQLDLFVVS